MGIEIQTAEITKDLRTNADRIRKAAANITALLAQCDMFSESGMVGHAGNTNATAIEDAIKTCNTTTNTAEKFVQLQRASLITRTFLYSLAEVMRYLPQGNPFSGATPPNPMALKMSGCEPISPITAPPNCHPGVPSMIANAMNSKVSNFDNIMKHTKPLRPIEYEDFEDELVMKEFWSNTMEDFGDIYDIDAAKYTDPIKEKISKIIRQNYDSLVRLKLIFELFYETLKTIENEIHEEES